MREPIRRHEPIWLVLRKEKHGNGYWLIRRGWGDPAMYELIASVDDYDEANHLCFRLNEWEAS